MKIAERMQCKVFFLLGLAILLTLFQTTANALESASSFVFLSASTPVAPTIDGVQSPGEWASANQMPVFSGSMTGSVFYVMNDAQNLYLALSVIDSTYSSNDIMTVRFDNDYNGFTDDGDDIVGLSINGYGDSHFEASTADWWTPDSQVDGTGASGNAGTSNFFEVSKPLKSGDPDDFNLSTGDIVGFCLSYFKDGTASCNTSVHPCCCRLSSKKQAIYTAIVIQPPRETCLEDDSGALDIAETHGAPGSTVTVPVRIQIAPNQVASFGFEVAYNTGIMEYEGYTRGECVTNFDYFDVHELEPGLLVVGGFEAGEDAVVQGSKCVVVNLEFTAHDAELCTTSELASLQELVDDMAGWSVSGACFTAISCDINRDGDVTPGDALCCFQSYMGFGLTPCGLLEEICCDVNMDGESTPADALEIFKEYLGMDSVCSQ